MITRNVFGRLEYRVTKDDNMYVTREKSGPYKIIKEEPWYKTEPMWGLFFNPPEFDSFIKAAIWLKNNREDLI